MSMLMAARKHNASKKRAGATRKRRPAARKPVRRSSTGMRAMAIPFAARKRKPAARKSTVRRSTAGGKGMTLAQILGVHVAIRRRKPVRR